MDCWLSRWPSVYICIHRVMLSIRLMTMSFHSICEAAVSWLVCLYFQDVCTRLVNALQVWGSRRVGVGHHGANSRTECWGCGMLCMPQRADFSLHHIHAMQVCNLQMQQLSCLWMVYYKQLPVVLACILFESIWTCTSDLHASWCFLTHAPFMTQCCIHCLACLVNVTISVYCIPCSLQSQAFLGWPCSIVLCAFAG